MDNQQILERAIQKAIDGGWKYGDGIGWADVESVLEIFHVADTDEQLGNIDNCKLFIFDHDFAQSIYGSEEVCIEEGTLPGYLDNNVACDCFVYEEWGICNTESAWQYHLQQMVIADDPIKYLGENI